MTLITKNVTTLTELKTLVNQGGKAAVIYDAAAGTAFGLDLEVLINMDASIAGITSSGVANESDVNGENVTDALNDLNELKSTKLDVENVYNGLDKTEEGFALDARQGKALNEADVAFNLDVKNMLPAVNYYKRMAAFGATIDKTALLKSYMETMSRQANTQIMYIPQVGMVECTSGVNKYATRLGDMSVNNNDAVQSTEATQGFVGGYIAPNEMRCLKFTSGQTQTGLINFTIPIVKAATDSWTLRMRVKINKKGSTRIYLGANGYIALDALAISLSNGTTTLLTTSALSIQCGRTITLEFQYSNGVGLIKANEVQLTTTALSGGITFDRISYNSTYPFDGLIYSFSIFNARASESESTQSHTFLSAMFPDIESVTIGNQVLATSNFEGIVAGDGTVVNEAQGATTEGNAELVTNGTFDTSTGWTTSGESTISGGVARLYSSKGALSQIVPNSILLTVGKWYRLIYDISSNLSGAVGIDDYDTIIDGTVGIDKVLFFKAKQIFFKFKRVGATDITIDNVSIKEVGASDSTLVYNYVYAQTTGTAAVKDLAATKAAAMWCHYNNLSANGAVYGKLYNWYAVHLFDLYPPVKGWRVPSKLDFDQLIAVNGGNTVAGGKLKVKFGAFNNTASTNESGFSLIAGGRRMNDGAFQLLESYGQAYHSDGGVASVSNIATTIAVDSSVDKARMQNLRLLRNEPAGQNELSYTSGLFTTDITSTPKQIPISFGRMVDAIRIKSENALTAIEAKLYNAAGTAVATLITAKTIGAGETKMFNIGAVDYIGLPQDGTVRVTAAGNSGSAIGMEIEVLTHKGVLS